MAVPFSSSAEQSGRYQYKYWSTDKSGGRVAVRQSPTGDGRVTPDLINTAYRNSDGTRVVYGLIFDLDADRAEPRWKDREGRLDWPRMRKALAKAHPEVASYVTHVVRSTGGQGLGVVIAINPLPLIESTLQNQEVASNLQARLISLFMELGFGADPSARGLERDFPNFNDPDRLVARDQVTQRRIEKDRVPVVSLLHAYLNKVDAEKRARDRIYRDARVEEGLSRLVGWLLGAQSPDPSLGLRTPFFLSGDEVWVTIEELRKLTGLSVKFLRKFLKTPPNWLFSAREGRGEWRLAIPLSEHIPMLLERFETLAPKSPTGTKKTSFNPRDLTLPEFVTDGERNHWLTLMALAYKWAGYSEDTALRKIALRMEFIPGYESSRNCRQVKAIVKSIYKNMPETFGMLGYRDLPTWMKDDEQYKKPEKVVSPRRGETPCASALGFLGTHPKGDSSATVPELLLDAGHDQPAAPSNSQQSNVIFLFQEPSVSESSQPSGGVPLRVVKRLVAIRRRQRVGIFDGDKLVVCLTRRHYQASRLLERLAERPEYASCELKIYTPHKLKHQAYYSAIDECDVALKAEGFCGRRETRESKFVAWMEKKGVTYQRGNVLEHVSDYGEIPF